jgi:hypothetical protein
MTPSVIDPATFRFVAQCLNHCATACPRERDYVRFIKEETKGKEDGEVKNIIILD